MQWQLLELNMLATLARLLAEGRTAILFGVKGHEDKTAIAKLLLKEYLGYHQVEKDVAERHLRELEEEIKNYHPLSEYDPWTGETITFYPADYDVIAREISKLQKEVMEHNNALASFCGDVGDRKVQDLLDNYEIGDRADLDRLKATHGDKLLIELFGGSYGLEADPETQLLLRRYYFDFPEDRDWL